MVRITSALLSVYYKDGLEDLANALRDCRVEMISTGGTMSWLLSNGHQARSVEDLTQFPEMLGGRVKTLHPKVFGGILFRREEASDHAQVAEFDIPSIDLVVVNLYPFEETVASGASHEEIIEKIDIGGVSLIRAAAKNHSNVAIVADPSDYASIAKELLENKGYLSEFTLQRLAAKAFRITAAYDAAIASYLETKAGQNPFSEHFIQSFGPCNPLRYGENPHQKAAFYGQLANAFEKIHGKELSYNNLVDVAASLELLREFGKKDAATVIVKHTNACGVATSNDLSESYSKALACDPVSAFGGVIAVNREVDKETAILLNELFFEVLSAPSFSSEALSILQGKKNRILLIDKELKSEKFQSKSILNGLLVQETDDSTSSKEDCKIVTQIQPNDQDWANLLFAEKIAKHTKSNTIVLARSGTLLASGTGQTSRVDALKQAIQKAKTFGFDLSGCAMASDAFFPFPDCVEIAAANGISSVIQPGGSIKDQESIDACNRLGLKMVTTGIRHFKH